MLTSWIPDQKFGMTSEDCFVKIRSDEKNMEIVNFLAQFWGFSLVVISLALLIKPRNIENVVSLMDDQKNATIFGIANVMLGIVFILLYNVWSQDWKVVVTVLAWLILLRGMVCLFFPEVIKKGIEKVRAHRDWFSYLLVALTILGCLLVYWSQVV